MTFYQRRNITFPSDKSRSETCPGTFMGTATLVRQLFAFPHTGHQM
jgi:hypothetical protein